MARFRPRHRESLRATTTGSAPLVRVLDLTAEPRPHRSSVLEHARRSHNALRAEIRRVERERNARETVLRLLLHDLRGPLSDISALIEELSDDLEESRRADGRIDRAARAARAAQDLIRQMTEYERMAVIAISGERNPVEIRSLLRRLVDGHDTTSHPIHVRAGDEVVHETDGELLARAVDKLVKNAVIHTPFATSVWLDVTREPHGVEVTVRDDGPGVPRELRSRIWEPFDRGCAPVTRPGLGLGLALVRDLVRLLDGSVELRDGDDGGACFVVVLPNP